MNEPPLLLLADLFRVMMRRQGWTFSLKDPFDGTAIQCVSNPDSPLFVARSPSLWYEVLAENTFRKLLRAILNDKGAVTTLQEICGKTADLQWYTTLLEQAELITVSSSGDWIRGPALASIDNIGPTLEWYVAQWYENELQAIARRGVSVAEVRDGGDLDVIAFINDIRIMVECKSSKPENISERDLRWFLQRAADFNPEIAILLIDTDSAIESVIDRLNQIIKQALNIEQAISPPMASKGLYWGMRNIFVTNVRKSVGASLDAVHRLYFSSIRHLLYPWDVDYVPPDYVGNMSHKDEPEPAGEEQKRHAIDILSEMPGQQLFKAAQEVDDYLREERDSWER